MGYHVIDPSSLEPIGWEGRKLRSISEAAGFEKVGLNHFLAEPGEQLPLEYHQHDTQEEAFFVSRGTIHVETPDEEFVVGDGEFFTVNPGNPHRAFVPDAASEPAAIVAIGAPRVSDAEKYDP
ncbi:cupin domain-containing protein [Natronosalvus vescus]|uniref:cupin domain-containing protein n=1 Tax=Natronosalvus vescus TaxID=2953881 RepID=UPI0020901230|nr:cupin domain-containing protein [Natronosalvus vescus]